MKTRAELYQFKHGTRTWYFTNQRKVITHAGIEYLPIRGLSRTAIEDESIDKCDTEVTLPQMSLLNAEGENLAAVFAGKIFYGGVTVTILELYQNETLVLHKGRVTQPKFDEDADTLTLVCETGESYLNRNILTRKFQSSCPNSIYDRWCGLNFNKWSFEVTVTAINDLTVSFAVVPTQMINEEGNPIFEQIPVLDELGQPVLDGQGNPTYEDGAPVMETKAYPAGWVNLGLLVKDGVYTTITAGGGNSLSLYRQHIGLKVGDVVRVAPGCDQSLKTCHEKLNNSLNFAGHPFIPSQNPIYTQLIK
ncbi:phage BR0599 family protein [Acinetobacter sp. YH12218]|uniref:phage BR0599 family protein n=1 Tax=Acinetobacter sp. YH12218 TaxID=2601152 RepID=UPI0015D1D473|nr:phage BR0599 family protein [Acinetobacter sp. YH12218]